MTDESALVPMTLEETMSLGDVLAKSGYFQDARQAAQAVVKVLAGRELGFGPIASMSGVHIVQGKPTLGANLLAAAIKGSGRYTYRTAKGHPTDTECSIEFYERDNGQWVSIGTSSFTMDDAQQAGMAGKDNWRKYPRNMLFARALSNGARWYCPDVFGGVTPYTPEELGAVVDGETGEVISNGPEWTEPTVKAGEDDEPQQPQQAPRKATTTKAKGGNGKSYGANDVRAAVDRLLTKVNAATNDHYQDTAHLYNAMKKLRGDDFTWGNPNDTGLWDEYAAELTLRLD